MQKRIPSLDGIRAVSILLVLMSHFINDMGWPNPYAVGVLGVRIFFIISGFLITGLLLKEIRDSHSINLRRFYLRRTLRIFPPFYFYILVMLLLSAFGWASLTLQGALPAIAYVSNYIDTWNAAGFTLSHSWSLSTEEQFYLIWPFSLVFLGRKNAFAFLLIILISSPIARGALYLLSNNYSQSVDYFHLNADHIATGCVLAFIQHRLHASNIYQWLMRPIPAFCVLAAGGAAYSQQHHPGLFAVFGMTIVNLSIAFCVDRSITYRENPIGRFLNSRVMVTIGILSYSIYIWQQPFLHLHSSRPVLLLSNGWQLVANPYISVILIALLSVLSYYLVEQPSLRLRGKIERHLYSGKDKPEPLPIHAVRG